MRIYTDLHRIDGDMFARGSAVAIGKFDAVHLGHQALIAGITRAASNRDLEPVVFTFVENPLNHLKPGEAPPPIMSTRQRLDALAAAGVSSCVIVPFNEDLADIPAKEYIEQVLVGQLRAKHICVGDDFRFGRGGAGDVSLLAEHAGRLGYELEVVAEVDDAELGRVSSSRIRAAILQGDVATAARLMGRPTAVRGEVVRGDARGRALGFPTANVGPAAGADEIEGLIPAEGVYAGWAVIDGVRYEAAISVGVNMTFEPNGEARVEAYLLDFDGDLYGKAIEVRFAQRLRGMVAFTSVDALVTRMREDVRETRDTLVGR